MNLLSIETATKNPSTSLFRNEEIIYTYMNRDSVPQATDIPSKISEMKEIHSNLFNELDVVAVSIGPGSFTGIRVGLSLAKGIAFAMNLPIIPVNTLHAIQMEIDDNSDHVIAMLSHSSFIYNMEVIDGICGECILSDFHEINNSNLYAMNVDGLLKDSDYYKVSLSSEDIGKYALIHKKELLERELNNISPIYLTEFH